MMPESFLAMTARDRRTLVVGVCVVAAGGAVRAIPVGWRWLDRHTIAARAAAVDAVRSEQSVRQLPQTRAELALIKSQLGRYDSATVHGDAPAAAGAELAELVSSAATAAEASITSVQLMPVRDSNGALGRVSARASVTGDLEALAIFLEGMEAGPEIVAIRALSITQPEANLPATRREMLRAEIEVEALYRPSTRVGRP